MKAWKSSAVFPLHNDRSEVEGVATQADDADGEIQEYRWTIWPEIVHRPSIGFSHIWSFGQACNWWPHVWFLLMQSLEFGLMGIDFHASTHG